MFSLSTGAGSWVLTRGKVHITKERIAKYARMTSDPKHRSFSCQLHSECTVDYLTPHLCQVKTFEQSAGGSSSRAAAKTWRHHGIFGGCNTEPYMRFPMVGRCLTDDDSCALGAATQCSLDKSILRRSFEGFFVSTWNVEWTNPYMRWMCGRVRDFSWLMLGVWFSAAAVGTVRMKRRRQFGNQTNVPGRNSIGFSSKCRFHTGFRGPVSCRWILKAVRRKPCRQCYPSLSKHV